jgi:small subunit ribosomal protein S20
MPNTKSAIKALRKSKKRYIVNQRNKELLKAEIKKYKKLIEAKNIKEAEEQLKLIYKKLDKAAKTNLIKKNKASRLKSRLTKKLNQIKKS